MDTFKNVFANVWLRSLRPIWKPVFVFVFQTGHHLLEFILVQSVISLLRTSTDLPLPWLLGQLIKLVIISALPISLTFFARNLFQGLNACSFVGPSLIPRESDSVVWRSRKKCSFSRSEARFTNIHLRLYSQEFYGHSLKKIHTTITDEAFLISEN